jgi:hypothetical protein
MLQLRQDRPLVTCRRHSNPTLDASVTLNARLPRALFRLA